jgi:hypothetical protein
MKLGLFPAPHITIFLAILGLSLIVASLDFMKRRARNRVLASRKSAAVEAPKAKEAPKPNELPKTQVVAKAEGVETPRNPVGRLQTVPGVNRLARLPDTDRTAMPKLAFGDILPLPMPAPRWSPTPAGRNTAISWWPQGS